MDKSDKKIFAILFFSIFSSVTGVGIVVPLLPVYAHDLGASGIYIGLIFGVFSLSRTFFLPFFGRSSDQNGRKPYIVTGLFAYTIISIAFIFSKSIESLIAIRFIQGIASAMIMPVTQAYVGDISPPNREGSTMGLFNMSVFMGLSLGPLAGGVIKDYFSLQSSFICMGVLALIAFCLSLFLLPPTYSERAISRRRIPATWGVLLKDREIAGYFSFRFAYTACIGMIWGFLPIFADSEFSLSSSRIGILVTLGLSVSGLMNALMGPLADRITRKRMLSVIGGLIVACAVLSFEWSRGFWDLFLINLFFGIGGGISMSPIMAMAAKKGNKTGAMGSVMAIMTMAHSGGMTVGAILAGLIMDYFHLRQAFTFGAVIMFIGVGLFAICTYQKS